MVKNYNIYNKCGYTSDFTFLYPEQRFATKFVNVFYKIYIHIYMYKHNWLGWRAELIDQDQDPVWTTFLFDDIFSRSLHDSYFKTTPQYPNILLRSDDYSHKLSHKLTDRNEENFPFLPFYATRHALLKSITFFLVFIYLIYFFVQTLELFADHWSRVE